MKVFKAVSIAVLLMVLVYGGLIMASKVFDEPSPAESLDNCFQAGGQVYQVGMHGNSCIFVNMPQHAQSAQDSMRKAFNYDAQVF